MNVFYTTAVNVCQKELILITKISRNLDIIRFNNVIQIDVALVFGHADGKTPFKRSTPLLDVLR